MSTDVDMQWLNQPVKAICQQSAQAAAQHQTQLTKPLGALGELETVAVRLAGMQNRVKPEINRVQLSVFAADHGIAASDVSAYPQEVTSQMVMNFAFGGAAVSVLARHLQAAFEVVNLGTLTALPAHEAVVSRVIAAGTRDFSSEAAMSSAQLCQALAVGCERVDACAENHPDLFIAGEMGIGNTSAASAIAAALLQLPAVQLVGPGTGLDTERVVLKAARIQQALDFHALCADQPLEILRCVGGFEIAAMTGAYIRAAQQGIPVLIDGFISSAAAMVAVAFKPEVRGWLLYGHCSEEPAHRLLLDHLGGTPLLSLGMRLGEGSGAALAVDILRSACRLHAEMATFADAGVSDKTPEA
ncbi:nicotinate-nucleotide--dimethylbenzimidazole phosphoribosyltransferase [Pontibacterium granulatum]|uniref:nicotinate-nucleotide--dimethylbenzimidazole phosphoribosyltransferase n=1 Tax=Pontibacterium granulatum TaxID=2036029 RepID=UPI00249AAB76|nr:nicotinate-nucleotide--dimethylbenzimidazole phosphoribosyltransferase [Pontibacterium granulatum]MDI3323226.1 nicotinate-nucleotide--dimethylbenzimidazole phosphoribosyltransferase [Pontibacterium granulatum]